MNRTLRLCLFLLPLSLAGAVGAADLGALPPKIQEDVRLMEKWGSDAALAKEITKQNEQAVSLEEIQKIDKAWIAKKEPDDRMKALLGNPCATRLKELSKQLTDMAEAFVMDNQGALVCMTERTSDYWQGDEPKWQESFLAGKGAVFVDKATYDESTRTTLIHISIPVMQNGKAIGVITAGIKRPKPM